MIRHFNYYLTGAGWAEAWFVSDSQKISFEVSYLSDPIFELCSGLALLADGSKTELEIVFAEEPGEHCLYLRKKNDLLLTEIYWSDEWSLLHGEKRLPTDTQPIYREEDTFQNFSSVVCTGIQELLNRHSHEGYKEKWMNREFPNEAFERLNVITSLMNGR